MAVMVKNLYKNGTFLYNMKLISGKAGMNRLVKWVHIIEDADVTCFLHGSELVFTAGILNNSKDWLINFARRLHEAEASAFVVNIGPHTKEIPQELIDYCNEVSLPLFTIPWETRMVDMTRDFCTNIMKSENIESSLAVTIQNIIFNVGDFETQILQLERYGYQRNSTFSFVCVSCSELTDEQRDILELIAEASAKNMHDLFVSFYYKEHLALALVNYSDSEIQTFIRDFTALSKKRIKSLELHIGVSSNKLGLFNQNKNFKKAVSAMEMACKLNEGACFYDSLKIYKVLYDVNDKAVLQSFYKDTIGKIEQYDRENGTQLILLLKTYLEVNASVQLTAEELYLHRNTVANQLKKIEKIVGYNPFEVEGRFYLNMGLHIKNML